MSPEVVGRSETFSLGAEGSSAQRDFVSSAFAARVVPFVRDELGLRVASAKITRIDARTLDVSNSVQIVSVSFLRSHDEGSADRLRVTPAVKRLETRGR
jgi:hypothetical protein